jgi:hypothetical protein
MRDPEILIQDILEDKVAIKELTPDELDMVLESLVEVGEGLLDTEHHEVGVAMLAALDVAIDMHSTNDEFEQAIADAEARGATYWEFENPSIH